MSQSDIEIILFRLDALDKKVEEIRLEQKAITSRGICPAPGSCIIIQRDSELMKEKTIPELDTRVRALETLRAEGRGMALFARGLWAFVGAGGLGVLVLLYNAMKK